MFTLATGVFIVLFVSGAIHAYLRSVITLGLKEECPSLWHDLGEPLGSRNYNRRFDTWLFFRRYRAADVPAYLKSYLGALWLAQVVMLAMTTLYIVLLIGLMFEPRIESHLGASYPVSATGGHP